ncbi:MAG: hypothetical protein EOP04_00190 [Proteobacteria bacterium]|nr:MAG: hypothetical protein EOP04_00190 [Pseudomonadota bacterium]
MGRKQAKNSRISKLRKLRIVGGFLGLAGIMLIYLQVFDSKGLNSQKSLESDRRHGTTDLKQEITQMSGDRVQNKSALLQIDTKAEETAKLFTRALELGLTEVPSSVKGSARIFNASVIIMQDSCSPGDADLIKAASPNAGEKIWLLTVESVTKPGRVLASKRLSVAELAKTISIPLSLPLLNVDDIGMFFCQDKTNLGNCSPKPNLSKKDWAIVAKNGSLTDRIIYFQLLSQRSKGIFLIPGSRWDPGTLSVLQKDLGHWLERPDSSLKQMGQYLEALRPRPAKASRNGLVIPLPSRGRNC